MIRSWTTWALVAWLAAALCGNAQAGIQYSAETETLVVTDYPAEMPCTLDRLRKSDALFGWGKVAYDEALDAYTVSANLVIGSNDGTHTYFQIGSPEHPKETLIIKKALYVVPHWVKGLNEGRSWWQDAPKDIVNRLTLGVDGNDAVKARLIVDGGKVHVGRWPGQGNVDCLGGQIFVHHSAIAPATPSAPQPFGNFNKGAGMDFAGAGFVIENSTVYGFSGFMAYGLQYAPRKNRFSQLANTVIENCGVALVNGEQRAEGCTFRNLTVAVMDYGSLNAVLTDCTFADNQHNWALTHSEKGLTLIDCVVGAPAKGNLYRAYKHPKTGKVQYPALTVKRHLVVSVVDAAGKAVKGAVVEVRAEKADGLLADPGKAVTGADGCTPGKGDAKALLLTECIEKTTDMENRPEIVAYTYSITVNAKGFSESFVGGFKPRESWQDLRVALKKN